MSIRRRALRSEARQRPGDRKSARVLGDGRAPAFHEPGVLSREDASYQALRLTSCRATACRLCGFPLASVGDARSVLRWQLALHIYDTRPGPGHLCAGESASLSKVVLALRPPIFREPTSRSPRTEDPVPRRRYRLLLAPAPAVASMSLKKTSVFLCTPTNFRHASLPVL